MRVLAMLLMATALRADDTPQDRTQNTQQTTTQKMIARLSEEAEAFERLAPEILGRETLNQRTQKPPARFRPRVGEAARHPPPPRWQKRELISEYGFARLGGNQAGMQELRQVISVDGKKVKEEKAAQEELARAIVATEDDRKKEALHQMEKFGLRGAVADFGELLLLFTRREIPRYEFNSAGEELLDTEKTIAFRFQQLDGPDPLTVFQTHRKEDDEVHHLRLSGEIWVRESDFLPLRIFVAAVENESGQGLREEATVNYAMSKFGALLPVETEHQELRDGSITAENRFAYSDFHKFGASSDIKFQTTQSNPQ